MLKITDDLSIDPRRVSTLQWDRRHYSNGSRSVLVITMHGGATHRIEHEPWLLGGVDCYAIEKVINATEESKDGAE